MNEHEKIKAEIAKVEAGIKRRENINRQERARSFDLGRKLHKLIIVELAGIENAVRIRFRYRTGHTYESLNDVLGTITEVRRTLASVRFDGEVWDWPISDLAPAGNEQGFVIG